MKQSNYALITNTDHAIFSNQVNEALQKGHLLNGGLSIAINKDDELVFAQSLYKISEHNVKPVPVKRMLSEVEVGDKVIFSKSRSKYLLLGKEYEVVSCSDVWIIVIGEDGHEKTVWTTESYYRLRIVQ